MSGGLNLVAGAVIGGAAAMMYNQSQDPAVELAQIKAQLALAEGKLVLFDSTREELDKALLSQQRLMQLYQAAMAELDALRSTSSEEGGMSNQMARLIEVNELLRKELDRAYESVELVRRAASQDQEDAVAALDGAAATEYYTTALTVKAETKRSVDLKRDELGILRKVNRKKIMMHKLTRWHASAPMGEPILCDSVHNVAPAPIALSCKSAATSQHGLYMDVGQAVHFANPAIGVLVELDEQYLPDQHRKCIVPQMYMWNRDNVVGNHISPWRVLPSTMRWVRNNVFEIVYRSPHPNSGVWRRGDHSYAGWHGELTAYYNTGEVWEQGVVMIMRTFAEADQVAYIRSISMFAATLLPGHFICMTDTVAQLRWYQSHL